MHIDRKTNCLTNARRKCAGCKRFAETSCLIAPVPADYAAGRFSCSWNSIISRILFRDLAE